MAATLFHLGKGLLFSAGTYQAGAKAYFYRTATSTKLPIYTTSALAIEHSNPVVADSFGKLPAIYLDQDEGNAKYVIAPANDSDPPASAFETVDPFIVSDPAQAAVFNPDKTAAEIAAGIGTINSAYAPGDIRRYGAISDGSFDCASAWQAALAQASATASPKGASVYIPASQQGWKISAGATVIGTPFQVYGDNSYYSYLHTTADITPLTVINIHQNAGPVLRDICFTKSGASTKPGVHVQNSSHGQIYGCLIRGFQKGIWFEPTAEPPSSCYLWSIFGSVIIENSAIGIDAGTATNYLSLHGVTLAAQPIGVRVHEANGFAWYGGDGESISNIAVDLDASIETRMGAVISGVDFENCAGDSIIRIGATALIRNVTTVGNGFYNSTFVNHIINAQRVDRLTLIGDAVNTAPLVSWLNTTGPQLPTNVVVINPAITAGALSVFNGTLAYYDTSLGGLGGRHAESAIELVYSASITPNAALGNVFKIAIADNAVFTINNPTNIATGQRITFVIQNGSGTTHGNITWGSAYKLQTWTKPADGFSRSIEFWHDGTNYIEQFRSANDVPV